MKFKRCYLLIACLPLMIKSVCAYQHEPDIHGNKLPLVSNDASNLNVVSDDVQPGTTITNIYGYTFHPKNNKSLKAVFDTLAQKGFTLDGYWGEPVSGIFSISGTNGELRPSDLFNTLNAFGEGKSIIRSVQRGLVGARTPFYISQSANLDKTEEMDIFSDISILDVKENIKHVKYQLRLLLKDKKYMKNSESVISLKNNAVIMDIIPVKNDYIIILTSIKNY